jgi:hypothetical protein
VLTNLVIPGCYILPPLKRISSRDPEQETKEGNTITFLRAEIKIGDYTPSNTKLLWDIEITQLRTILMQLTTSLEIDEDGDSGKVKGKRLSKTWRMPNKARNWRLVQRSSRTLKPKLTKDELELLPRKPDPFFSS